MYAIALLGNRIPIDTRQRFPLNKGRVRHLQDADRDLQPTLKIYLGLPSNILRASNGFTNTALRFPGDGATPSTGTADSE